VVSVGFHVAAWWLTGDARTPPLSAVVVDGDVVVDVAARRAPVLGPPGPVGAGAGDADALRGRRTRRPRAVVAPAPPRPPAVPWPDLGGLLDGPELVPTPPVAPAIPAGWTAGPTAAVGPSDEVGGAGGGGGATFGPRARPRELVARVVGSGADLRGLATGGAPLVSLKEATALRTRDYFPRLPAALWPEARPYIVRVGLCVSEAGRVSEVALQSSASPTLDPVVLTAVRSWRYRPRVVDGQARPFCHAVTIAYERTY
jgi:hypothetical protein